MVVFEELENKDEVEVDRGFLIVIVLVGNILVGDNVVVKGFFESSEYVVWFVVLVVIDIGIIFEYFFCDGVVGFILFDEEGSGFVMIELFVDVIGWIIGCVRVEVDVIVGDGVGKVEEIFDIICEDGVVLECVFDEV